jgi:hypothetical protein
VKRDVVDLLIAPDLSIRSLPTDHGRLNLPRGHPSAITQSSWMVPSARPTGKSQPNQPS